MVQNDCSAMWSNFPRRTASSTPSRAGFPQNICAQLALNYFTCIKSKPPWSLYFKCAKWLDFEEKLHCTCSELSSLPVRPPSKCWNRCSCWEWCAEVEHTWFPMVGMWQLKTTHAKLRTILWHCLLYRLKGMWTGGKFGIIVAYEFIYSYHISYIIIYHILYIIFIWYFCQPSHWPVQRDCFLLLVQGIGYGNWSELWKRKNDEMCLSSGKTRWIDSFKSQNVKYITAVTPMHCTSKLSRSFSL